MLYTSTLIRYTASMPFHIRSNEADQALRELQTLTGESLTEAVRKAIQERLDREKARRNFQDDDPLMGMAEIWERLKLVPILDTRTDDEILGYGPDGLPS